jgi:hypothetical protein
MAPRTVHIRLLNAALIAAAALVMAVTSGHATSYAQAPVSFATNQKAPCIYTRNNLSLLRRFERRAGRTFTCAEVYSDASPDWKGWFKPWFLAHPNPDFAWPAWVGADPANRRLIIAQSMIPTRGVPANWRERGASGRYDRYIRELAVNLVAKGLGSSVIRLGHEMNGTWFPDNVGSTRRDFHAWRAYFRRIVRIMRSVPGAHFSFDWNISAGYRAIPFSEYYPGDDAVDIVGIDFYDYGFPGVSAKAGAARWRAQYGQPGGLRAGIAFARKHRKPISLPEWGLATRGGAKNGIGDDPYFVSQIAKLVKRTAVAYQAYFECPNGETLELASAPRSMRTYRRHFSGHGDAVGGAFRHH